MAIAGNTAVVGAIKDDDKGTDSGSAYVFEKSGDSWNQMAKLTAADGAAADYFGFSVAIFGDTVVVGAFQDDVGANLDQGSAYVFVKPAGGWITATQTAKLTAADGAVNDAFGISVAITEDTVVVGAPGDDSGKGSTYVFVKPGGGWITATQTAKLTASDGAADDILGFPVAIVGDTVVVGAYLDDDNGSSSGSVYVFVKPGGGWITATQTAKLTASDGAEFDFFGFSVAIAEDTVVVGAYFDDSSKGSAYVFVKPGGGWLTATQTAKLTAADGAALDGFGYSVAIVGDTVVVGAYEDDDKGTNSGSAYVFVKPGGGWVTATQMVKLTAADGAADDNFGLSVAIAGNTVVVGARGDDSYSGSAYIFGPVPEIEVWGNGQSIPSGDTTPDPADGTNFGSAALGETVLHTFTISNSGSYTLSVNSLSLSGVNAADFSLSGIITPALVSVNSSATFQVTFAPTVTGTRVATVTIANDDSDENPYRFAIQGTGTNQAPLANAGSDQSVIAGESVTLNGSASADPDGHTPLTYGWTQSGGPAVTFKRYLSITTFIAPGSPAVLTFTLVVTDSFGLADPTPDEVVITVVGTPGYSSSPAISSTINVGIAVLGTPVTATLTISETGNTTLNVTGHNLSGANAADFTVTPAMLSIPDGGAAQTLAIRCVPGAGGLRVATLTVNHDAPGSPAMYTLNCTGVAAVYLPLILKIGTP